MNQQTNTLNLVKRKDTLDCIVPTHKENPDYSGLKSICVDPDCKL